MGAPWQGLPGAVLLNELGCSVHVQCTCKFFAPLTFSRPTGQAVVTTDAKLASHMYITPTCVLLWLLFLWGAGCTRQRRKTFLAWGPPV